MYFDVSSEDIRDFSVVNVVFLKDGFQPPVAFVDSLQVGNFLEEAGHGVDIAHRLHDVWLVEDDHPYVAEFAYFLDWTGFHDNKSYWFINVRIGVYGGI